MTTPSASNVFGRCLEATVVTVSAAWRVDSASWRLFSAIAFFFFLSSLIDLLVGCDLEHRKCWSLQAVVRAWPQALCSSFCFAESNFPSAELSFKRSFSFRGFFCILVSFPLDSASSSAFILASSAAAAAASAAAASSEDEFSSWNCGGNFWLLLNCDVFFFSFSFDFS